MRTLLILPHLDDESISCGGLIQKRIAAAGPDQVSAVVLFSRVYNYGLTDGFEEEHEDFKEAAEALGLKMHAAYQLKEGEPAQVGYYEMLQIVEKSIEGFNPDEVIIPAHDDLNQDHRFLNDVCRIALRPFNLGRIARILEFFALDGTPKQPSWYEALSQEQLLTKQKAVGMYRREAREGFSPRSPANIEAQARVWGSQIGEEFAEAYRIVLGRH